MISCVINTDTRPSSPQFSGLMNGPRSRDFLVQGVRNKKKFLEGMDVEILVHVDEHETLTTEEYQVLHSMCDCVVVRKHSRYYRGSNPFSGFNDISYLQALSMARGDYIMHFDQDMAAFRADISSVQWMLNTLDGGECKFVCYPSSCSPAPCHAPEYDNKFWASTRFFVTKRDTLDFGVLERAIRDPQWFYRTYDRPPRENPWTEQFLGIMGGYKVLYPYPNINEWVVFPWMRYEDGTLDRLAAMSYPEIVDAVNRAGGAGIFYDGVDCRLMGLPK